MNHKLIQSFSRFTQIKFNKREINHLKEGVSRKDWSYDLLTRRFYYAEKNEKIKLLILAQLLEKINAVDFLSKASYIYALLYKWEKSIKLMEQVIILEQGKNIDSWIDFWFFLRKFSQHRKISTQLLLWLETIIIEYKNEKDLIWFLESYCNK